MREESASRSFERGTLDERPEVIGSEQVCIRNHDQQWGYDLALEIVTPTNRTVFGDRYYLQPGQVERELDVVPPGEYEVIATLDNLEEESLQCRIDAESTHTVVIEMGYGGLSLTHGLDG